MFIMSHTKASISIKQLERELGVTYKTAWRIYKQIHMLMEQNNRDLLSGWNEFSEPTREEQDNNKIFKWTFFNKFEIKVVEKQKPEEK